MSGFTVPNERQKQLCSACGVDAAGVMVILENDTLLVMKHLQSGNEITIYKGFAQRRKEQHDHQ